MNPEDIITIVANHTATTPEIIKGRRKSPNATLARELAAYLIRSNCRITLEKIGEALGDRTHSTALKIIDAARTRLVTDRDALDLLTRISTKIKQAA